MTDILHRAWNVLEPGERPEGMVLVGRGFFEHEYADTAMSAHTARDRLIVAVEDAAEAGGADRSRLGSGYHWELHGETPNGPYDHGVVWETTNPDRLTAAVLALESERGSHA